MKQIFKTIIAQCADGLEKSTIGTIIMFACLGFIGWFVAKEGCTETVESLITTAMIIGATLLGVNSVTDIFKVNRSTQSNKTVTKGGCNPPEQTNSYEQ